jgi:hypothetical protein
MMFLKTKFFLLVVLVAVASTFYYFGDTQKLAESIIPKIKSTPFASIVDEFESLDTQQLTKKFQTGVKQAESEITSFSKKTAEISQHTGNVLGSSITPVENDDATPVHEKAFEYGKYVYCQQVVKDYQILNPSLKE